MQLPSPNDSTIEATEAAGVESLVSLSKRLKAVGGPRSLLFAQVNWDAMNVSASPPGAPSPRVAQASYTRQALRRRHERQVLLRRGRFAASLRARHT